MREMGLSEEEFKRFRIEGLEGGMEVLKERVGGKVRGVGEDFGGSL